MRIRRARLRGREGFFDVEISGGRIAALRPLEVDAPGLPDLGELGREDLDAAGALVCEPFVDAHVHLDYANTVGQPRINESGTLFEAISIWAEHKEQGYINRETVIENAVAAVRSEVEHGVGFIRTHVDVTDPELTAFHAIAEVRDQVRDICEVSIIAFPQNGLLAYRGGADLVERALKEGADVVGGIPHFERSREAGVESIRIIFDLAEKYGLPIDAHCDEIDDADSRFLEVLALEAVERGMQGRVTASHAVASAFYGAGYMAKLLPKLVDADMRFAVNPTENLHLQGWGSGAPMPRAIAPIREFMEAGLNVALGQDSIADPWYPLGEGALLRMLDYALHAGHMLNEPTLAHCLDFITVNGARNLCLDEVDYGIAEGKPANLILLDATDDKDAVWHQADVLASIRAGKVVFTAPRREVTWMA